MKIGLSCPYAVDFFADFQNLFVLFQVARNPSAVEIVHRLLILYPL